MSNYLMQSHNRVTGVFQIPWLEPMGQYESALVYELPNEFSDKIDKIRSLLKVNHPVEFQLEPHLTLIFLGHMNGTQLFDLCKYLYKYRHTTVEVLLGDFGIFRVSEKVINIHIKILEPLELFTLHEEILSSCLDFTFFSPGSFVGHAYIPHISILDKIDIPSDTLNLPEPIWTIGETLKLRNTHLISKRLE